MQRITVSCMCERFCSDTFCPKGACSQPLWALSNFVPNWDHLGIGGSIQGENKPGTEFCSWNMPECGHLSLNKSKFRL